MLHALRVNFENFGHTTKSKIFRLVKLLADLSTRLKTRADCHKQTETSIAPKIKCITTESKTIFQELQVECFFRQMISPLLLKNWGKKIFGWAFLLLMRW